MKYSIGLASLKMGAVAGDGGMGQSLTAVDGTVSSSATLTTAAPQTTDFFIEEKDDPVFSFNSKKAADTLKFSLFDVSPDTLGTLLGGVVSSTTAPPTGVVATPSATGGTLAAGQHPYVLMSIDAKGITTPGPVVNAATTGATGSVVINFTVDPNATKTRIFKTDTNTYFDVNAPTATFTDTGAAGTAGTLPAITTAGVKTWNSPPSPVQLEQSLQLTAEEGYIVSIPRGKVIATLNWAFDKTKLAQVDILVNILAPTKAGVSALQIAEAA